MGGNKDAKRQAEEDRKRADEERRRYEALLNTQLQTQQKVDPLEERLKTGNMNFLDAVEGKGEDGTAKPFDIRDSRLGLAPNLALFDSAVNRQDEDRQGQGLLTMGQATSNPNLTALLSEQRKSRAAQDAGGGLERAFSLRNAEVRGSALPLIGIGQQRNATGLGALSSIYGGAAERYGNASRQYQELASRPSFWQQLALAGIQGAAGVGAGMASGGTGFFRP